MLAIAETLIAAAVFLWIAATWGTQHLTISACIAPLLLLRTPKSQSLGLQMASPCLGLISNVLTIENRLARRSGVSNFFARPLLPIGFLLALFLAPVASLLVKSVATHS